MSATDKAIPLNPECCRPEIAAPVFDKPYLTILPSSGRASLDLKEVWQYRELLYFLIWRDIKLRYKQTALGAIWAIIQPLLPMLIFTLFFGRLAHVPSNGIAYSLFAYAGLLPWTYFSNAVSNSSSSVVGNANLVTKVYFPRMLIPLSGVLAALVDFFIASVILIAMMIWYRVPLYVSQLWAPLILLAITLLAAGTGMLFAALNVRFRDVRFVLPFFCSVLDVRNSGDLSRQPGTCKMAVAARSQSHGRNDRRISRGTLRHCAGMADARDFNAGCDTTFGLFRLLLPARRKNVR